MRTIDAGSQHLTCGRTTAELAVDLADRAFIDAVASLDVALIVEGAPTLIVPRSSFDGAGTR
jgi:hypothetical protein